MDIYLFSIIALILFSIITILYIRISKKEIPSADPADNPADLKPDDFTILE